MGLALWGLTLLLFTHSISYAFAAPRLVSQLPYGFKEALQVPMGSQEMLEAERDLYRALVFRLLKAVENTETDPYNNRPADENQAVVALQQQGYPAMNNVRQADPNGNTAQAAHAPHNTDTGTETGKFSMAASYGSPRKPIIGVVASPRFAEAKGQSLKYVAITMKPKAPTSYQVNIPKKITIDTKKTVINTAFQAAAVTGKTLTIYLPATYSPKIPFSEVITSIQPAEAKGEPVKINPNTSTLSQGNITEAIETKVVTAASQIIAVTEKMLMSSIPANNVYSSQPLSEVVASTQSTEAKVYLESYEINPNTSTSTQANITAEPIETVAETITITEKTLTSSISATNVSTSQPLSEVVTSTQSTEAKSILEAVTINLNASPPSQENITTENPVVTTLITATPEITPKTRKTLMTSMPSTKSTTSKILREVFASTQSAEFKGHLESLKINPNTSTPSQENITTELSIVTTVIAPTSQITAGNGKTLLTSMPSTNGTQSKILREVVVSTQSSKAKGHLESIKINSNASTPSQENITTEIPIVTTVITATPQITAVTGKTLMTNTSNGTLSKSIIEVVASTQSVEAKDHLESSNSSQEHMTTEIPIVTTAITGKTLLTSMPLTNSTPSKILREIVASTQSSEAQSHLESIKINLNASTPFQENISTKIPILKTALATASKTTSVTGRTLSIYLPETDGSPSKPLSEAVTSAQSISSKANITAPLRKVRTVEITAVTEKSLTTSMPETDGSPSLPISVIPSTQTTGAKESVKIKPNASTSAQEKENLTEQTPIETTIQTTAEPNDGHATSGQLNEVDKNVSKNTTADNRRASSIRHENVEPEINAAERRSLDLCHVE